MQDSLGKASTPSVPTDDARSLELYQKSQTFLLRTPDPRLSWLRICTVGGVLALFFIVIPALTAKGIVADYKLNILGKYLCFAIVALGIDLIWGYTGLLSLCQALFFALGAYAMAMHLSLPEGGGQYDYPQFMTFAYYGHGKDLPWFWVPFRHFSFALIAGVLCRESPPDSSDSSSFAAASAAFISPLSLRRWLKAHGCLLVEMRCCWAAPTV